MKCIFQIEVGSLARIKLAGGNIVREVIKNKVLFLMLLPVILYFIIFHYAVMPGAYVAFVDYKLNKGIFGSNFIGLKNFEFLVQNGDLWNITKNTLLYNIVFLALGNIIQIVFAIMLSEISASGSRKCLNPLFSYLTLSLWLSSVCLPTIYSISIPGSSIRC